MNVSEEKLIGSMIVVGVAVFFFSFSWPKIRAWLAARRFRKLPLATATADYTYEQYKADLLNFDLPVEKIVERCGGKVPKKPVAQTGWYVLHPAPTPDDAIIQTWYWDTKGGSWATQNTSTPILCIPNAADGAPLYGGVAGGSNMPGFTYWLRNADGTPSEISFRK